MFNADDLEIIHETLEIALADPDFIDTTSGGGMTEQEAEALRERMREVQAKASHAASARRDGYRWQIYDPSGDVSTVDESAEAFAAEIVDMVSGMPDHAEWTVKVQRWRVE